MCVHKTSPLHTLHCMLFPPIRLLKEMFPDVSEGEIHEVYVSEAASMERTVERLVQLGGVQGAQDTRVRQLRSHGRKDPKTSKVGECATTYVVVVV